MPDDPRAVLLEAVVDHLLADPGDDLTDADVAAVAGVDPHFLRRWREALGVALPEEGARGFGAADVAAARRLRAYLDLGLPEDGLIAVSRTVGLGLARVADAALSLVGEAIAAELEADPALALRYVEEARTVAERDAVVLAHVLDLHLRQAVRARVIAELQGAGELTVGARDVAVAFADLVGFTELGEEIPLEELATVVDVLAGHATSVARPPVTLVKTLGDGVLLVSIDAAALVSSVLTLVEAVDEDPSMPRIRAGIAYGAALPRAGDWFGRPVNLASRITAVARPGAVVADAACRDAAGEVGLRWTPVLRRPLKGVRDVPRLHRVRRA